MAKLLSILFAALLLSGCLERTFYRVTLPSGETHTCAIFHRHCGLHLHHCDNGKEYECMINIQKELIK
jgi:hypothetical protein